MGLHISDIKEDYDTGKYSIGYNYPGEFPEDAMKKLPADYVFDEDLSVKRNREMVIEHNDKVEQLRTRKRALQADLDIKLTEDVVKYIEENYDLTSAQARIVEMWVYREKHAFMSDYFDNIDTFAEFADDIANLKEE
jgi:hypothetical protein